MTSTSESSHSAQPPVEGASPSPGPDPRSRSGLGPSRASTTSFSLTTSTTTTKPSSRTSVPLGQQLQQQRQPLLNGGKKRPLSSLHAADDDEDEDNEREAGEEQQARLVSGFDHAAGGAIELSDDGRGAAAKKTPLVIAALKNRDWREESRRRRREGVNKPPFPKEVLRRQEQESVYIESTQTYGLSFIQKENVDEEMKRMATSDGGGQHDGIAQRGLETEQQILDTVKPKTDDELALEALTGDKVGGGAGTSNLVLAVVNRPSADNANDNLSRGVIPLIEAASDDISFRADVLSRPDSASLDDYAAVPVEEFGAALLRGMGWKEGDVVGKRKETVNKLRVVERRPALLGIGAKELPGGGLVGLEELGAWGKSAMAIRNKGKKNKKKVSEDTLYSPVVLRNMRTGETLTEEELKGKMEDDNRKEKNQKEIDQDIDWRQRRDRNLQLDFARKEKMRNHGGSERFVFN